ncbi:hypothetical protein E8E12_010341 [Didymella heteroderae]|uniref:Heterokaryon incompatibility domain-containing protein n=1 Tax=Didymella heteroderae TaxID=1769908 RepID=A0A9P5C2Y6_9PLEO|nr:hypothetical protein E8E12_010341 [Didymella heteroderae]
MERPVAPGRKGDSIVCTLHAVNLLAYDDIGADATIEGFERYEAISYVWGSVHRTVQIECDGMQKHVTKNLADALEALRHLELVKVLWADALCINQEDLKERAEQVKLMGLIYWKARRVRIWLGQDDDKEELHRAFYAIEIIRRLSGIHLAALGTTAEHYKAYTNIRFDEPDSITDTEWTAIHRLLDRAWFERVWVVQELGLARDAVFHCGDECFSRSELQEFTSLLNRSKMRLIKPYNLNLQMLHLGQDYWRSCWGNTRLELGSDPKEAETFFDILARARGLSCTDPRDTVYAFLGHPSAFKQRMLDIDPYHWYPRNYYEKRATIVIPDYRSSKSNSHLDVYHQLAVAAIANVGLGPNVLSHVGHNEDTIEAKYPSWVPRWNLYNRTTFAGSEIYFAASGLHPPAPFRLSSSRRKELANQLSFKALRLDSVRCVRRVPLQDFLEEALDLMALLLSDAPILRRPNAIPIPSSLKYPYEEPFVLAFASTMTAGLTSSWNMHCEPADKFPEQHVRNFHAYFRRQQHPKPAQLSAGDAEYSGYFALDVRREDHNRVLFITHDGRLGLGPSVMEGSDEIWIPLGSKMPVILRRYGNGMFKIVGQAFVYGVMRGEAVQGKSENDFQEITLW